MTEQIALSNINSSENKPRLRVLIPETSSINPNLNADSYEENLHSLPNYYSSSSDEFILLLPNFSTSQVNQSRTLLPEGSINDINDIENGQSQLPWTFTKKCYIYGYCFFPLWYIGTLYNFSKEKDIKYWARMCTLNVILISTII